MGRGLTARVQRRRRLTAPALRRADGRGGERADRRPFRRNVALITDLAPHPIPPADALAMVGLSQRRDHFPSQLSGGEQQRVAIARAIAKRPSLLLCDEPTGALDFTSGRVVLEVIERANREVGSTTVVITHNAAIGDMADRVIQCRDGRIVQAHANAGRRPAAELGW